MRLSNWKVKGLPVRGIVTVFGCFITHLMLGAFYTFGNIMPYLVSYMRAYTDPTITYRLVIMT